MSKPTTIFIFLITLLSLSKIALATNSVYYSISPFGTGDIKTGSPTITILSGVATLSVAQTGNIGMGVCIDFAGGTEVWISQVNSPTSFDVVTATGATPTDVTIPQTVNSIHHEYASLNAFEAGFTDSDHINNTDLTATGADVVAYACCYYDHDDYTADTTAVAIYFGTTDSTHYLEIFTPTGGTQSINNQRHSGNWDDRKYCMVGENAWGGHIISVQEENVRIDGLQFYFTSSTKAGNVVLIQGVSGVSDYYVSNLIIKGPGSNITAIGDPWALAFYSAGTSGSVARVWNNLIYDFNGNKGVGYYFGDADVTHYVYNNAAVNVRLGFQRYGSGTTVIAKNNLAQSCVNGFTTGFDAASDYNISDIDGDAPNATFGGGFATVIFAGEGNGDFHLDASDTAAKDQGISLNPDPQGYLSFSDDIDSQSRPWTGGGGASAWDIGADEYYFPTLNIQGDIILKGVTLGQ